MLAFPDLGTGACINCGFLSQVVVARNETQFYEMSEGMRASADVSGQGAYVGCFVRQENLHQEVLDLGGYSAEHVRQVLEQGRDCPQWHIWRAGYGPKEHSDERIAIQLERDRRMFEERLERDRRNFDKFLAAVVVLLALAQVAAALAGIFVK